MELNFIYQIIRDEFKLLSFIIDTDISSCFNCQTFIETQLGLHNLISILGDFHRDYLINSINHCNASKNLAINISFNIKGFN